MRFRVNLKNIKLTPQQLVYVTGNVSELGNWDPNNAISLKYEREDDWRIEVKEILWLDQTIFYRYFIGIPTDNGEFFVTYCENFSNPREYSCVKSNETNDVFGTLNGNINIIKGCLTHGYLLQFHIVSIIGLKCDIYLKLEKLENQKFPLISLKNDIFVQTLNHNEANNIVQQKYGKHYKFGDYLVFQAHILDTIGLIFEIFTNPNNQQFEMDAISTPFLSEASSAFHDSKNLTIPILNAHIKNMSSNKLNDLENVWTIMTSLKGNIHVEYLVIKPTKDLEISMEHNLINQNDFNELYLKFKPVLDIGHRGLGCSFRTERPGTLMENTIASLSAAGDHGADFVEFDVQLTKDLIPILYHDFTLCPVVKKTSSIKTSLSGCYSNKHIMPDEELLEVGIHQLTLKELRSLKLHHSTALSKNPVDNEIFDHSTLLPNGNFSGCSSDDSEDIRTMDEDDKVEQCDTSCVFPKLSDVLDCVDPDIGFNVELKYPLQYQDGSHESIDGTYFDMNQYCDIIIRTLIKHRGSRKILLSSFHPDVCLMLRVKQNTFPVLYCLQDEHSNKPFKDERTQKFSMAVNFCLANNFLGMSVDAKLLLLEPELSTIGVEVGLVLLVWGSETNDPATREQLKKMGVQGIIYDRISDLPPGRPNIFTKERLNRGYEKIKGDPRQY